MRNIRYLQQDIQELCFDSNKMAFISGPRQAGKTTMAKNMLQVRGEENYYNWDEIKFRRLWTKDPSLIIPATVTKKKPLVVLDEIHKAKLWKRNLKGVYDTMATDCDILVTGSAKLNVYRKGSDSLLGRYHHFRLHPFSLSELLHNKYFQEPDNLITALFQNLCPDTKRKNEYIAALMKFGGFPEPLFSQSSRKLNLWQRNRLERLVREDLRDLSRIPELSQVEMLTSLMPERASNPLSIQSLSEDIEVSYNTVKNWLRHLAELYYHFEIKPYSKSLPRSIKKEGKLYLWDWSEIQDQGARFENLIASHLLKYCHYLTDTGYGKFELRYLRTKEKKEIDFLLLKDNHPWLPLEIKLNNHTPSQNWDAFMNYLPCDKAIQIVEKSNVFHIAKQGAYEILIISASNFLSYLI